MEKRHKHSAEHVDSHSLPIVEILVVITIITALLLGVIVSTNPLGSILAGNRNSVPTEIAPRDIPLPPLAQARKAIQGGMEFFTAMNDFPQVIGGYIAPYAQVPVDHPYYLEVSIRDRNAPVTKVLARIEAPTPQEIPLTLIDGTGQEGTWGGVWRYHGKYPMYIVSYDEKNNMTKVGLE